MSDTLCPRLLVTLTVHCSGNTVENMFHVSFLVKQRVVQLSVDESIGLPVLEPVSSRVRDAAEEGGSGKNQVSIQSFVNIRSDDEPKACNHVIFTPTHYPHSQKDISTHAYYNDTCTSTLNKFHNDILIMTI